MAITFDGLMESIEKYMEKCGEVDNEFLSRTDLTIPMLKEELARWKELAKIKNEETKAVKKVVMMARDFFVKMDKVFKADAYVIDTRYVLPGTRSTNNLVGEVYLDISDEFREVLRDVIFHGEEIGVWYIPSIPDLKAGLALAIDEKREYESPYQKMDNDKDIRDRLMGLLQATYDDMDNFVTIPHQEDPQIITRKKLFALGMGDVPPVRISIQLLPTVSSEEELEPVEYCLRRVESIQGKIPVFYARFRIWFSHFTVNVKYLYAESLG